MKTNLRQEARRAVARAKAHIASEDHQRLRYAALELRFAMEALTYERAQAYSAEIPPKEYATWQPRKVLELLLEIDPTADQGSTLMVGVEKEYGKAPGDMSALGSESVLDLKTLKKHYDALGSFLHMPTWRQLSEGKVPDAAKLHARCDEIVTMLEVVLSSSVFNVTLGAFATIDCMRCEEPVRKRLPHGKEQLEARCFECGATYRVLDVGNGQVDWKPIQQEVPCPCEGCDEKVWIWQDQMKIGTWWTCHGCSKRFEIRLGVARKETDSS